MSGFRVAQLPRVVALGIFVLAVGTSAQEPAAPAMTPEQQAMMEAYEKAGAPGTPHQALAAMAGSYDVQVKSWHEPGGAAMESVGSATRSMILGGRVMVEQFQSTMMGVPFTGQGMFGFDNVSGKSWSTWNDSMSTGLMVSEGSCDEQNACTFTGSWNDPVTKGPLKARMSSRWISPTVEIFEMYGPGPDGKEMKMMEITYTKK